MRPGKEQNATQTILSVVSEGYKFSVSNLMVLFFPFLSSLCFHLPTKGSRVISLSLMMGKLRMELLSLNTF